jgi:organic radical activating enzyme
LNNNRIRLKISRWVHPVPKILFNLHGKLMPKRPKRIAKKYGQPINAKGDHLHIYLTLRCNFKCYFCVNRQYADRPHKGWIETNGATWLSYLNRLYDLHQLYLQGGEPFLHSDIVEIINGLDGFNVCIYTNLPHSQMDKIRQIRPGSNNIIMLISYHPLQDKRAVNEFVDDFRQIPAGILKHVHLIETPEVSYKLYARAFRRYNVFLERQDVSLATEHNVIPKDKFQQVWCNSNMEVVSPDMRVYRCLGLMLRHCDDYTKHLADYNFEQAGFKPCDYYGLCGQCATAKEIRRIEYDAMTESEANVRLR